MSPFQGSDDEIRKMCFSANESTWITSSSKHGNLDINYVKTSDFLDFTEAKSRSDYCKIVGDVLRTD
jgi:hypothetical protein